MDACVALVLGLAWIWYYSWAARRNLTQMTFKHQLPQNIWYRCHTRRNYLPSNEKVSTKILSVNLLIPNIRNRKIRSYRINSCQIKKQVLRSAAYDWLLELLCGLSLKHTIRDLGLIRCSPRTLTVISGLSQRSLVLLIPV